MKYIVLVMSSIALGCSKDLGIESRHSYSDPTETAAVRFVLNEVLKEPEKFVVGRNAYQDLTKEFYQNKEKIRIIDIICRWSTETAYIDRPHDLKSFPCYDTLKSFEDKSMLISEDEIVSKRDSIYLMLVGRPIKGYSWGEYLDISIYTPDVEEKNLVYTIIRSNNKMYLWDVGSVSHFNMSHVRK